MLADLSSPTTCLGRLLTWAGELDAARLALEDSGLDRYRGSRGHRRAATRSSRTSPTSNIEPDVSTERRGISKKQTTSRPRRASTSWEDRPVRAAVACASGNLEEASRFATEGLAVCERTADIWNEIRCRSVLGFMEIWREDPVAAHRWLGPLPAIADQMGLREPGAFPFVPDAVEALVALGEPDRAEALTDRLEEQGGAFDRPLATGTAARCRGLIAAAHGVISSARRRRWSDRTRSLARCRTRSNRPGPSSWPAKIARRMKKKGSARELIGDSIAVFDAIGSPIWSDKAQRALARIGGRPPATSEFTPSEEQVALLVADGRSNREVAASLFMSVNTVEANLKRIYRKLSVRSRVELAKRVRRTVPTRETYGFR